MLRSIVQPMLLPLVGTAAPIAGGGGGLPPKFLGASLLAWWTADRADLITLSGSQVTSWKDVVAGYDEVQGFSAARPVYSSTSFGGAPGLTFDGSDDELSCTDAALLAALPNGSEPGEIWVIVQQDALVSDAAIRTAVSYGGAGFATQRRVNRTTGGGANRAFIQTGDGTNSSGPVDTAVNFSSRHVVRAAIGSSTTTLYPDGSAPTSLSVIPATGVGRLRIGATPGAAATQLWNGKVRDVLVTGPLTTEQATALQVWALPRRML